MIYYIETIIPSINEENTVQLTSSHLFLCHLEIKSYSDWYLVDMHFLSDNKCN